MYVSNPVVLDVSERWKNTVEALVSYFQIIRRIVVSKLVDRIQSNKILTVVCSVSSNIKDNVVSILPDPVGTMLVRENETVFL